MERVVHPISPVFDKDSRILILGSFPSVKSREGCFFYHHPQNRFWKVLAAVTKQNLPVTIDEKKDFLLKNHIAVWDVIASCTIDGSSDSTIRDVVPSNLTEILDAAGITAVFCNGTASYHYYGRYQQPVTGFKAIKLPSTSPANAAWSLERLTAEWNVINDYL